MNLSIPQFVFANFWEVFKNNVAFNFKKVFGIRGWVNMPLGRIG